MSKSIEWWKKTFLGNQIEVAKLEKQMKADFFLNTGGSENGT